MAYRSATQRVEANLVPMFLLGILWAGVSDHSQAEFRVAHLAPVAAAEEAVADCDDRERRKILTRAKRAHAEIAVEYDGAESTKVGLIAYWLLRFLTDDEYMMIASSGPMKQGVDLFLGAVEHAAVIDPLMASARKQARKLLKRLQDAGYFQGVQPAEARELEGAPA